MTKNSTKACKTNEFIKIMWVCEEIRQNFSKIGDVVSNMGEVNLLREYRVVEKILTPIHQYL
jgi:hypothetical protein